MKWTEFLRGINGGVEVNRLVGFLGGIALIVYEGYSLIWLKRPFDQLAFAGGVALVVGGTGAGAAIKDTQAAKAQVIVKTHSKPAEPPAPAPETKPDEGGPPSDAGMPDYAR